MKLWHKFDLIVPAKELGEIVNLVYPYTIHMFGEGFMIRHKHGWKNGYFNDLHLIFYVTDEELNLVRNLLAEYKSDPRNSVSVIYD